MRFNWNAIAAIGPIIFVIVGWGISIEVRMSQRLDIQSIEKELGAIRLEEHQQSQTISNQINNFTTEVRGMVRRIQNLEDVLTPVLVDYRVRKELERQGVPYFPSPIPVPAVRAPALSRGSERSGKLEVAPSIVSNPPNPPNPKVMQKPIEEAAQRWAQEAIQRGQQKVK
jgi:hypothetical protein